MGECRAWGRSRCQAGPREGWCVHLREPHSGHWVGVEQLGLEQCTGSGVPNNPAGISPSRSPVSLFPPSPAAPKHRNIQRTGTLGVLPDAQLVPHPSSPVPDRATALHFRVRCTYRKARPLGGSDSALKVRRWRWLLGRRCSSCGVELLLPVWPGAPFLLPLQEETGWTCWKPTPVLIDRLSSSDLPVASR